MYPCHNWLFIKYVNLDQKKSFLMLKQEKNRIVLSSPKPGQCYKTFFLHNLLLGENKLVFVPGRPFQPNLIFVGKARSLPWEKLRGASFK